MEISEELAVRRALDWFLEPLPPEEWCHRKQAIVDHIETFVADRARSREALIATPVSITSDRIGCYLHLAETALSTEYNYEHFEGARILPILQRIGTDLDQLVQIDGIEAKRSQLIFIGRADADSLLFEMLVALLWKKNGWPDVSLLPESPPKKCHDIRASDGNTEWAIECKRLAELSDYSRRESDKWHRMWQHLSAFLARRRLSFVIDIVFHVELESLADTFLLEQLADKLQLAEPPCTVISDKQWDVSISAVDFVSAAKHLAKNLVKYPSDQLYELVAGRRDARRKFAAIVGGDFVRIGGGAGNNLFLDKLGFAAGAFWHCDAERSVESKARDIRSQLARATSQLPDNIPGVVHVGLETRDGTAVEAERYRRIINTVRKFDSGGKDLRWVFCNLYQSYCPPDQIWVFDETVYFFNHADLGGEKPLSHTATIIPKEYFDSEGVHWLRDAP